MQLKNLNCSFLGKSFNYYEEIDSTQDEIWRLIDNKKVVNGQLIAANIQTKGKGTHGRIWHTDESHNIAFSFYVEMGKDIDSLDGLTYEIAQVIVELFKDKYGIVLDIKLPNDIMCNNRKLGGILTEAKVIGHEVKYLVIGVGINTNKMNFTDDIKDSATSIKKEFNIEIDSIEFITEFCNRFEKIIQKRSE